MIYIHRHVCCLLLVGPYMILEYCEEGTLKEWLDKKKKNATDDVFERLFRIVLEIAQGMQHLASKKVIIYIYAFMIEW